MNNKACFLAFNRMNGVGPRAVATLWARWPKLQELFQLTPKEMVAAGVSKALAETIRAFDRRAIEADLIWEKEDHHALLTLDDPRYPPLLKEIHDPPPVLYAAGDISCFDQPMLAMVGTRKPSITGSETAWHMAKALASHGITVVSGLASGIDGQAHGGALAAAGKTIAVMGTGIDRIYPTRHVSLAKKIVEKGLLLSELPLQFPPIAGHFPRRNRIISGLSLATLVVEAAIKSGSLITARMALEQNRDVLAIPSSIYNAQARGCHHLLQQGAKLVTSYEEVLEELGLPSQRKGVSSAGLKKTTLASGNQNLVQCIGFEVTTVDHLIKRSGLAVEAILCDLAKLELAGLVKAVPGGYMRCTV